MALQIHLGLKKCVKLFQIPKFRLYASVVFVSVVLYVYVFVLCPSPVYVDEDSVQNLYISFARTGRTGNQLFSYASLLGIANKTGRKPVVPLTFSLHKIFDITHVKDVDNGCWEFKQEAMSAGFDSELYNLPLTNVNVGAYLQSWRYFHHIQDTVRSEFTFKSHIRAEADRLFKKHITSAPNNNSAVVGVHVRRGDHVTSKFSSYGYTMADLDYFKRAMAYMRSHLKNPKFLVVGDDLPWVRDNLNFADTVIADDSSPDVHLALLSLCDHMIQSTGTFSWWAGWFVRGHVVYYKNYPAEGSWLESITIKRDHYPPHWVAL